MESGLRGKSVIVAGASQGMGRAAAQAFAAEGAKVAICARTERKLNEAAEQIRSATGSHVLPYTLDVTDGAAMKQFVSEVVRHFGTVHVCVANAGGPPAKNFAATNAEDWRKAFELNFMSAYHLISECLPHMQKQKWGRIVTITSTSVKQPIPDLVLSSAIRPAVVGLVKSLAIEYGRDNITANNIGPGYTTTERLNDLAGSRSRAAGIPEKEIYDRWAAEVPLKRLGKPEEIADAIVWLASERASYVTGQNIMVDGGIYKGS